MTIEQREAILFKVKEMLDIEDLEVILEEQSEVILTPVNNSPIGIKKIRKILFIINNNIDAVKYNDEVIAKILAK
jgi:hypothetical protein